MPDFITVMKEWARMCKASVEAGMKDGQGCMHHCILPDDFCGDLCCAKESDIIEAERAIMKWAMEHPAPIYPTWDEWLFENLGLSENFTMEEFERALKQPIREDIAEKLGLPQKEAAQ